MVLKYLVPKGWLVLWAKEKPGAASTPGAATLPPAAGPDAAPSSAPQASTTPPPAAAVSLVGSWRSPDGEVLRIGASSYESYELNQLVDKGTYELRKNLILTRSSLTGLTGRFSYQLQGQQLSLRDSDGETFHYRRIK